MNLTQNLQAFAYWSEIAAGSTKPDAEAKADRVGHNCEHNRSRRYDLLCGEGCDALRNNKIDLETVEFSCESAARSRLPVRPRYSIAMVRPSVRERPRNSVRRGRLRKKKSTVGALPLRV